MAGGRRGPSRQGTPRSGFNKSRNHPPRAPPPRRCGPCHGDKSQARWCAGLGPLVTAGASPTRPRKDRVRLAPTTATPQPQGGCQPPADRAGGRSQPTSPHTATPVHTTLTVSVPDAAGCMSVPPRSTHRVTPLPHREGCGGGALGGDSVPDRRALVSGLGVLTRGWKTQSALSPR